MLEATTKYDHLGCPDCGNPIEQNSCEHCGSHRIYPLRCPFCRVALLGDYGEGGCPESTCPGRNRRLDAHDSD